MQIDTSVMDFSSVNQQIQIIRFGKREDIIEWLAWNDPDGCYRDTDTAAEGLTQLSLEELRRLMWDDVMELDWQDFCGERFT